MASRGHRLEMVHYLFFNMTTIAVFLAKKGLTPNHEDGKNVDNDSMMRKNAPEWEKIANIFLFYPIELDVFQQVPAQSSLKFGNIC